MNQHRLQKIISASGLCSRRDAEDLIIQKRVKVNGNIAEKGEKVDPDIDKIHVDDLLIKPKILNRVILINKPVGVISSRNDPHHKNNVLNILPKNLRKGLYPAGRLDINSRGALILTNNGELTFRITHPKFSHPKTYHVLITGKPSQAALKEWREGLILDGKLTMKADVKVIRSHDQKSLIKVVLKEGRNRQIRRIVQLLGHKVIDLQRTAIGSLQLNGLPEGGWRELEESEWLTILK